MTKINMNEEIKCGYLVSKERKEIWAIELDLLEQFIRVANKYKLTWWVSGGTLLGTVRHGGFIPWDDDIDICMPRSDYDQLCSVANKEFKGKYFFQNGFIEEDVYRIHSKLRNTDTVGYLEYEKCCNITKGVFIDIFPLDNIPDKKYKEIYQIAGISFLYPIHRYAIHPYTSDKGRFMTFVLTNFYKTIIKKRNIVYFLDKMDCICKKYNNTRCTRWGLLTLSPRDNGLKWNKDLFEKTIQMKFEYLYVNIPSEYGLVLKQQYGNYMEIPKNKSSGYHGSIIYKGRRGE